MEKQISIFETEYRELKHKAEEGMTFLRENQILHSENSIAAMIQQSMLPSRSFRSDNGQVVLYADMDSAKEVGGDFYDYMQLDEDHLYFCIADVSGKGVPAIIHMVACKMLLRNGIKYLGIQDNFADLFEDINEELYKLTTKKQFVTCFAGIYEYSSGKLEYVNAGHTKTIVINQEGLKELADLSGLPLGAYYNKKHLEKCKYKVFETILKPGDLLFAYTDGCSEAMNSEGNVFGLEKIEAILNENKDKMTLENVVKHLQRRIIQFENHETQDDDLTILAIQIEEKDRDYGRDI